MMDKDTTTLKRTLAHNRAFSDNINRSGIAWCYTLRLYSLLVRRLKPNYNGEDVCNNKKTRISGFFSL